ncbi:MAG: DUF3943 domain-containing protein [Chlorobi bacterium]|nr:DUF3943 domain-containing protein [Chlorobiota bacterium]
MKIIFTALIFLLFISQNIFSQTLYATDSDSLFTADSGYIPNQALVEKMNPRKPLWLPIIEGIGLNLALGAFNSYVMNSEFAKISFKSIEYNFERGWSTDADELTTNMFAHPIHGSIYYNLARSSGYNYWTSLGVAAIGSWQWEFFMEIEPPALNDWVMTSYGGSMLGEMFYRFSNLIIDESATGGERFWRELGAGIFNPGRLFNRLITGKTSRVTNEKLYERQPFVGELAIGGNNVAEGTDFKNGDRNLMITAEIIYGRLFERTSYKPFSFFRFNGSFNFVGEQPLIGQLRVENILTGKSSKMGSGRFLYGVFGHYDFLNNSVYEIGAASVGLSMGYRSAKNKKVQFIGLLHGSLVLMGGANSDYVPKVEFLDSARTYNMGPGASAKLETFLRFPFGAISLDYSFWWIHTWDGAMGDEFIGMLQPKIRIKIYKKWFVGLEWLLYHRVGKYDDFPNRNYRNNEQRLFIGYSF